MSESQHEHGHGVGDEIKSLEQEAEVGESARTPAIAIGGVAVVVFAVLVVVMVISFTAYYLTN
jgi:hypothetical protein